MGQEEQSCLFVCLFVLSQDLFLKTEALEETAKSNPGHEKRDISDKDINSHPHTRERANG